MVKTRESKEEKAKIVKEAKENEELYQFIKSLTKQEIKQIKDQRSFEELKPNTYGWKTAIMCDQLRRQVRIAKLDITKRIIILDKIKNEINHLKKQKLSGRIIQESRQGIKMTDEELDTLISEKQLTMDGEVTNIPVILADIRKNVGHLDVNRQVIMSEEEYEKYAGGVHETLKARGYDPFSELE